MNRGLRICGTIPRSLTFILSESQKEREGTMVKKKKLFEEIMGKNFSDLMKDRNRLKNLGEPQIR